MSLTTRVGLLAGAAALTVTSVSFAGTTTDAKDLEARLAAAEAKIAELSAQSNSTWLTEQRANDVRTLVQDVLADADTRANLLAQGVTAGYDNGFVLASGDGSMSLTINGGISQRWIANDDAGITDDVQDGSDSENWLNLSGNVGDWSWDVRTNHNAGGVWTDDWAYISTDLGDGWSLSWGNMRLPYMKETGVNQENRIGVEGSFLEATFGAGDGDAIAVGYDAGDWHVTAAWQDGDDWGPWNNANGNDSAWSARFEYLMSGNWGQWGDEASPSGGEEGMLLGVGMGSSTTLASVDTETLTIDWSYKGDGYGFSFATADSETDGAAGTDGWSITGTYVLNSDWELFGRMEDINDFGWTTIGVNNYMGSGVRWTTDLVMSDDAGANPGGVTAAQHGLVGGIADEQALRTQVQLTF